MRGIECYLPVRSLTPPVASSTPQTHQFAASTPYAMRTPTPTTQVTHPLMTLIANDLECPRTPAISQPPSTTESMTIYFGQRCRCGTGCEGEDVFVIVFEGPLGMAKGDTSGCWSGYEALALSSSTGAPLLDWSRAVSPTKRQPNATAQGPTSKSNVRTCLDVDSQHRF